MATRDHETFVMKAGIRELRDRFTHYLDQVRRGREVIVTDRGREVAALIPLGRQESLEEAAERLRIEGLVEGAEVWRPVAMSRKRLRGRLLSELVIEERERSW